MQPTPIAYATDEDIALRASADYAILCPRDQCLAGARDGCFGDDPWTLTSQSVDFLTEGLAPGQVVRLTQPVGIFKASGEAFVVSSVARNAVKLRRKGQPDGVGKPPGPEGGVQNVEYSVTTLAPQIALAGYDLNRRFGIDDRIDGRRPSDLFDPREVREATVLTVLYRQYLDMSRGAPERADGFGSKAQQYRQELDDLLARTAVHWRASAGSPQAASRLNMRVSR